MIKYVRSYEVSIWTLQDSFITVLKPSNLEPKGQIQDPIADLKDDGENNLSFKIPMYLRQNGEFIENPIWFTTRNGNIIASMRKVKVIFNKGEKNCERVFEFLITKVTEEHEGFEKYCKIETEGLAFHELGKQGYKITLNGAEDVDYDQQEWGKQPISERGSMPYPNINYWADKIFKNSAWTYSVCMDWSAIDGIASVSSVAYMNMTQTERDELNNAREGDGLRRRDRIYEDAYVTSWSRSDGEDILKPSQLEPQREKYRLIEESESNRYNLCQTLAETFQVFTKYVYHYDDNYHIIGREVIFYNNFLNENDGVIDFTYKYNTKSLSREMDGEDLTTKMFVKGLSDEDSIRGETYISDTEAHKSREDYILNFDYLYHIGTISEEQYAAIAPFEAELHDYNTALMDLEEKIILAQNKLPEQEAKRDNALESQKLDYENINSAKAVYEEISKDMNNGNPDLPISITKARPQVFYMIYDGDKKWYYINVRVEGIIPDTIRLYRTYRSAEQTLENEIKTFTREYDEFGNIDKISKLNKLDSTEDNSIYATFEYNPRLKYKNVIDTYEIKLNRDMAAYEEAKNEVVQLESDIENWQKEYDRKIIEKEQLLASFERLMGPALRESTWQPEDEYSGFGDFRSAEVELTSGSEFDNDEIVSIGWDNKPFDDEQLNYYKYGILAEKIYYPCLKLSSELLSYLAGTEDLIKQVSLVFKDTTRYDVENQNSDVFDIRAYQIIPIGARMQYGFVRPKTGGNTIPVIFITAAETMTDNDDQENPGDIQKMMWGDKTKLCTVHAETNTNLVVSGSERYDMIITLENEKSLSPTDWLDNPEDYEVVYPRICVDSPVMKNSPDQISIARKVSDNDNIVLDIYEDYTVLYRDNQYFLTLKPESIVAAGQLNNNYFANVTISNTALAVYLDAIQVLKENAYPKVSYEIKPSLTDKAFTHNAYDRLGQLAHINDYELKFENVMGYVSELKLDLDHPWKDTITIKNYKTKFEDLFSSIVAQTENMKKNSYIFGLASDAFNAKGQLNQTIINNIIDRTNFDGIIYQSAFARAAEMTAAAADNKAALANSTVNRVMNGDLGLAFRNGDGITSATLSREKGLVIEGFLDEEQTIPGIFRVTNGEMGFFKTVNGQEQPMLYFSSENGDLALAGTVFASHGWFGGEQGWIIGNGKTINGTDYQGGLLYSANQRIVFAAGDSTKNQDPAVAFYNANGDTLLAFDGDVLAVKGTITALNGYIGNWLIGENALTSGSGKVGLSSTFSGTGDSNVMFWAGNATSTSAPFRVYGNGKVVASNLYVGNNGDTEIGTYITNNTNKSTISATAPTGSKTGDLWRDTAHNNIEYIYNGSSWVQVSAGNINGTNISVDANAGTINIAADSTVNIAANKKLSLATNGQLNISGSSGVNIASGSKISIASGGAFTVASGNFSVDTLGNVRAKNLYLGNGTTDVAGTLNALLTATKDSQQDIDETAEYLGKFFMVCGYKNHSYITLSAPGQDKAIKVNFSGADRYGSTSVSLTSSGGSSPAQGQQGTVTVSVKNKGGSTLATKSFTVASAMNISAGTGSVTLSGLDITSMTFTFDDLYSAVGFKSYGSWSSGSRTITLDNDKHYTVEIPTINITIQKNYHGVQGRYGIIVNVGGKEKIETLTPT